MASLSLSSDSSSLQTPTVCGNSEQNLDTDCFEQALWLWRNLSGDARGFSNLGRMLQTAILAGAQDIKEGRDGYEPILSYWNSIMGAF